MDHKNNYHPLRNSKKGGNKILLQLPLLAMVILMIVLQNINRNVDAKVLQTSKKTLKLFKSSSSLIQPRHKRDTFVAEQRQQEPSPANVDEYYHDENYDVIPVRSSGDSPPSLGDQISEKAKQVAESFSNMWQSLQESIKNCVDAIRNLFAEEEQELTPEETEQLRAAMEEQHQEYLKKMRDNEVYENQL